MINGHEVLSEKYSKMLTIDNMVHYLPGSLQNNAMGLGTSETYVGLVEQNIGQEAYRAYFKLYGAYKDLYRAVLQYEKEIAKLDKLSADLDSINNQIEILEKNIQELEDKRTALVERGDLTPEEEKEVENLTQQLIINKEELIKNTNNKRKLDMQYEDQRCACAVQLKGINTIQTTVEERIAGISQHEQSLNKFNDPSFEKTIEQDFIDASLLPGDEAKESELRGLAQSRFKMMKLESVYLKQVTSYASNLLDNVKHLKDAKQLVKVDLSEKSRTEYLQIQGMNQLSTDYLETSDFVLDEKAFSNFYAYMFDELVKTELGAIPTYELANLPAIAMQQFKIPQHGLSGFEGKLSQILHGYSTMFSIEALNPIFSGVEGLISAQASKNFNTESCLED